MLKEIINLIEKIRPLTQEEIENHTLKKAEEEVKKEMTTNVYRKSTAGQYIGSQSRPSTPQLPHRKKPQGKDKVRIEVEDGFITFDANTDDEIHVLQNGLTIYQTCMLLEGIYSKLEHDVYSGDLLFEHKKGLVVDIEDGRYIWNMLADNIAKDIDNNTAGYIHKWDNKKKCIIIEDDE